MIAIGGEIHSNPELRVDDPMQHIRGFHRDSVDCGISTENIDTDRYYAVDASNNCQQFLKKSADLTFPVDKVNLQNPVALLAVLVEREHL